MRISDWSSDVCSSDLHRSGPPEPQARKAGRAPAFYLRKALLLPSPTGDGRREMRRMLVAGNWKMNGSHAALAELDAIAASAVASPVVDAAICPPFTLIERAVARAGALPIGAQDCHASSERRRQWKEEFRTWKFRV